MINSIYTYDKFERDNKIVNDYTSILFNNLNELLENYDDYFMIITLNVNEKMENLSYKLYGSENYADLILACNDENFLWSSPYDQDILLEHIDNIFEEYTSYLNVKTFDTEKSYRDFKYQIQEEIDNANSSKSSFKVPKPEYLSDVLNIINNYKLENRNIDG